MCKSCNVWTEELRQQQEQLSSSDSPGSDQVQGDTLYRPEKKLKAAVPE